MRDQHSIYDKKKGRSQNQVNSRSDLNLLGTRRSSFITTTSVNPRSMALFTIFLTLERFLQKHLVLGMILVSSLMNRMVFYNKSKFINV